MESSEQGHRMCKNHKSKNRKRERRTDVTWSIYNLMSKQSGLSFGHFRKIWIMESTGYSPQDPGVTGVTYTGAMMRRGVVAVDPVLILWAQDCI